VENMHLWSESTKVIQYTMCISKQSDYSAKNIYSKIHWLGHGGSNQTISWD
jgi:hypothetical protein